MIENLKLKTAATVLLLAIVVLYGLAGITTVEPGKYVIVVKQLGENPGMEKDGLDIGFHWKDPLMYDVHEYDTRFKQESITDLPGQTKDGQDVVVDVSFEVGLEKSGINELHSTVGRDYWEQIVLPKVRSTVRTAVSNEDSEDVYTGAGRVRIAEFLDKTLKDHMSKRGILIYTNLRDIDFVSPAFKKLLEEKASAAQRVIIAERQAEQAEQDAIKTANIAEGAKQKNIKESEAIREKLRLEGEGNRLRDEETAKGNLALAQAEAEGMRLRREALSGAGGKEMVELAWAENLGKNVKVYGIPTGAPGTASFVDVNGVLNGALSSMTKAGVK